MDCLQDLHEALADDSEDPEVYNQISTLVDIAMEFIAPNMELRPGNIMEMAVQVRPLTSPRKAFHAFQSILRCGM